MGKPTVADLSAELETLNKRVAALEIRTDDLSALVDPADPAEFDDALNDDERAAIEAAEFDDRVRLQGVLNMVSVLTHGPLPDLLKALEADFGLKVEQGEDWTVVDMLDIEARARGDLRLALMNWCNAARRTLRGKAA